MTEALPHYIQTLLRPEAYDHPVSAVELVQTHISYVLLAGDFVYKFKKPVNFGFLDFSTLTQRQFYCRQELDLNRRLCPTIYLDVVPVNHDGKHYAIMGPGKTVEYGVRMRRLPTGRLMADIMKRGELTAPMIDAIVAVLVPFYDQAARRPRIDTFATAAAVGANVLENLHQIEPFVGSPALPVAAFEAICQYVHVMLAKGQLFSARIAEGHVRDGHGDLHTGNICLADQVYIFDCIEFNKRYRYGDVAADIAFLAMDLEYNGQEALTEHFVRTFEDRTGDVTLREVLQFYKCYRAVVRGKIGLLTAHDDHLHQEGRDQAEMQAARYLSLARRYVLS